MGTVRGERPFVESPPWEWMLFETSFWLSGYRQKRPEPGFRNFLACTVARTPPTVCGGVTI